MPWGADLFRDISLLGGVPERAVIFDVGANEGQTLRQIKAALPRAQVHCFEPADEPYQRLEAFASRYDDVTLHRLALSATTGHARLKPGPASVMNQTEPCDGEDAGKGEGIVTQATVESVAQEYGIGRLHLLKVDTEGHDLEVLRGADGLLREGRIDYVLAEVGFGAAGRLRSDTEVRAFMSEYGYNLLCIYGQAPTVRGHGWDQVGLFFANMLFVRPNWPPSEGPS